MSYQEDAIAKALELWCGLVQRIFVQQGRQHMLEATVITIKYVECFLRFLVI